MASLDYELADTIIYLILAGAAVNARGHYKMTPLHYAVGTSVSIIKSLLVAGADIYARDSSGETALTYVQDLSWCSKEIEELLYFMMDPEWR